MASRKQQEVRRWRRQWTWAHPALLAHEETQLGEDSYPKTAQTRGPALPGWLQTDSEATLEKSTCFTCTLTSHNTPCGGN